MSVGRRRQISHGSPLPDTGTGGSNGSGIGLTADEWLARYVEAHEARHERDDAAHEARHERNAEEARRALDIADANAREREAAVLATHEREHRVLSDRLNTFAADHEQRHDRNDQESRDRIDAALAAVRQNAELHAEAHAREHHAHEEMHAADADARRQLGDTVINQHLKDHTAHDAVHAAERIALDRAELAMTRRLEGMNEIRQQLATQAQTFATKENVEARLNAVEREIRAYGETLRARIELLEKNQERSTGKGAGLAAGWGYLVGGIGVVVVVTNLIFFLITR